MQLIVDCNDLNEVTKAHLMLDALLLAQNVKSPKTTTKKKPTTKKTQPEKPPETTEVQVEIPDETTAPAVTREQLLEHIKANFADNIQPIKDMLARMGVARVSEIPEDQLDKAMRMLTEG